MPAKRIGPARTCRGPPADADRRAVTVLPRQDSPAGPGAGPGWSVKKRQSTTGPTRQVEGLIPRGPREPVRGAARPARWPATRAPRILSGPQLAGSGGTLHALRHTAASGWPRIRRWRAPRCSRYPGACAAYDDADYLTPAGRTRSGACSPTTVQARNAADAAGPGASAGIPAGNAEVLFGEGSRDGRERGAHGAHDNHFHGGAGRLRDPAGFARLRALLDASPELSAVARRLGSPRRLRDRRGRGQGARRCHDRGRVAWHAAEEDDTPAAPQAAAQVGRLLRSR